MHDLRDCKYLIKCAVADEDKKDQRWRWSVKSVEKDKVLIFWEYLEYCEQPNPYFSIELNDTGDACLIYAKEENGHILNTEIVEDVELPYLNTPLPDAVEQMLKTIVNIARNCY